MGKRIKISVLLVLLAAVMAFGCASFQLPKDATSSEKRAALCMDAQAGLAMAQAALDTVLPLEAKKYWTAFQSGAQKSVDAYCIQAK